MTRILYVEDNPQNMDLVCRILRHVGGYEVFGAVDGMKGVAEAENHKPDLILMDINLPDISGLEAANLIKAKAELKHIPIVAFTADTNEADRNKYINAGCDGYLPKPASAQKLLQIVKEFLPTDIPAEAVAPLENDIPLNTINSPSSEPSPEVEPVQIEAAQAELATSTAQETVVNAEAVSEPVETIQSPAPTQASEESASQS